MWKKIRNFVNRHIEELMVCTTFLLLNAALLKYLLN